MHSIVEDQGIEPSTAPVTGVLKAVFVWIVWLSCIAAAYGFLLSYERTAGSVSHLHPASWPATTKVQRAIGQFTLVLFVHPKCPCTSATFTELAVLMTHCRQLKTYVLFVKPSGFPQDWEKTNSWYRAVSIPAVTVLVDDYGEESAKFRAATSGETFLYDPSGKLIFCGGITAGRGHEGDNQGLDMIESLVIERNRSAFQNTPVYGCALQDTPSPNSGVFRKCRK